MVEFTTVLPFETITSILSHISQSDCCECMRVCRRWHDEFPNYTKSIWTTLQISFNSWERSNVCLTRCLGPHVQTVSMFKRKPFPLLKALKDAECAIASLEVRTHASFARDFSPLFLKIVPFQGTLKELTLTNYAFDVPILRLLNDLSNLTHLTLLLDFQIGIQQLPSPDDNINLAPTKLVYLHLDNVYSFENRVAPMLRKSPRLKALVLSRNLEREPYYDVTKSSNYINTAVELCPQLRYVAWNGDCNCPKGTRPYAWREMIDSDSSLHSLRELILFGSKEDMDHIIPLLKRSQKELEYIELVNDQDGIPWNDLAHIPLPRLKSATLQGLKLTASDCSKLLLGCRDLEELHLATTLDSTQLVSVVNVLSSMKHLQYLQLDRQLNSNLVSHVSPHLFDTLSLSVGLQTVKIHDICVSDSGLLALGAIRMLRELHLGMNHHQYCIGQEALLAFAEKLMDGQLSVLSFSFLATLTDRVLERLALVKSLSLLSVAHNKNITVMGIKAFVKGGEKQLRASMCSSVSGSGLYEKQTFE
ncbi:hypothetical protein BJV82DRAFT_658714 [Fennellomyces sp. T-0311]|nr:hypothetical protein BJV82DRAFT_658714 [Fennellomyces sp. T-0311]